MELAKITTRGQTTIPKRIREAAGLHEGDVLAFTIERDHLGVRKVSSGWNDYLRGLSEGLGEWESPADEEAWWDL